MAKPWWPVIPAALAVCAALAGCATLPSGGAPRPVSGESARVQAYVLAEPPPPPTAGWKATDVVLGFLHASASYFIDPAAAKAYLAPSLRAQWNPSAGATVISEPSPNAISTSYTGSIGRVAQPPPGQATTATVTLKGQELATLSQSGQYLYAPRQLRYTFTLTQHKGVWLISRLPSGPHRLILTQPDFEQGYRPRNLYFIGPPTPFSEPLGNELVPDPVYAPIEGANSALGTTAVARRLVDGLFTKPGSWLSAATRTAFPPGTVLRSLRISDQTAIVDLTGTSAVTRQLSTLRQDIGAQLEATLTDQSGYSLRVARSLRLEIDGRTVYTSVPASTSLITQVIAEDGSGPLYFEPHRGAVNELAPGGKPRQVVGPAQIGHLADITAIASQPQSSSGNRVAAALRAGRGCAVWVAWSGSQKSDRSYQLTGGPCTSLSWDDNRFLWAVTAHRIWLLQPGKQPVAVSPPDMPGTSAANYRVLSLRMAPDSVRAALLVQSASGARSILLAAVTHKGSSASLGSAVTAGAGLIDAESLAWRNPWYLAVLANDQIYEVPLTGGAGQVLGQAPAGAQTLTTNGTEFVVYAGANRIMESSAQTIHWVRLSIGSKPISGSKPIYPG